MYNKKTIVYRQQHLTLFSGHTKWIIYSTKNKEMKIYIRIDFDQTKTRRSIIFYKVVKISATYIYPSDFVRFV